MKGLLYTIIGALLLLVSGLWGKARKAENLKNKAEAAETRADLAEAVTPIAVESAKNQSRIETEYKETLNRIQTARNYNDIDLLKKIAEEITAESAKRALALGAKEKTE